MRKFECRMKRKTQKPAAWKDENHTIISTVNSSLLLVFSSSAMENRQTGHVFRHTSSHLPMHALWNSCMHGRTRVPSPSFNLDKHTQHNSPSRASASPCPFVGLSWSLVGALNFPGTAFDDSLQICCTRRANRVHTKELNFLITIGLTKSLTCLSSLK